MKEFLQLARTFRGCAVVEDDFPLWRDRFDQALEYKRRSTPLIVCLCGSTRFRDQFVEANYQETMKGNIVLSVGFYLHSPVGGEQVGCTPEQKAMLDELHKRKIDLCDEVLILNVDGYIGDSTKSELQYARNLGKSIRWLNPPSASDSDTERKQF